MSFFDTQPTKHGSAEHEAERMRDEDLHFGERISILLSALVYTNKGVIEEKYAEDIVRLTLWAVSNRTCGYFAQYHTRLVGEGSDPKPVDVLYLKRLNALLSAGPEAYVRDFRNDFAKLYRIVVDLKRTCDDNELQSMMECAIRLIDGDRRISPPMKFVLEAIQSVFELSDAGVESIFSKVSASRYPDTGDWSIHDEHRISVQMKEILSSIDAVFGASEPSGSSAEKKDKP